MSQKNVFLAKGSRSQWAYVILSSEILLTRTVNPAMRAHSWDQKTVFSEGVSAYGRLKMSVATHHVAEIVMNCLLTSLVGFCPLPPVTAGFVGRGLTTEENMCMYGGQLV